MKLEKKFSFPVASRALAFVLASATFAACSSAGNGGSMVPPTDSGAPLTSTMPETSATPLATAAPDATATPSTGTQSIVSVSGSTATVTGNVVAVKTGAFQIQGGSGLGYIWIYTTSTTKYSGAKPYVGENVEVTGTGSLSSSLTATSVTQVGSTSSTTTSSTSTLSLSGKVVALKTGAFQIQGGSGVGYVWIYTTSTTTYSGSKPYVGESVSVKATGSLSTKVTAVSVTQSGTTSTSTPAPTATATPVSTTTTSSTSVAHYAGCPVFTSGDYYNAPITSAGIDPNSANYINSQRNAGNSYGFYASMGYEKVNQANNSTPLLTVKQKVSYHTFPVKYPWQSGFYVEPLSDAHGMVVQTQSCHLYESYSTTYSGGVLSAYSGANWDLTKPFVPMPAGSPSAMASGLSIFAGMVKWEDYQSGAIRHALNWAAPAGTVAAWKFVRPASDTDGLAFKGTSSYQLPYGAHLRLKASFSTAGMGPEATMVINAMKTYGIYLADTGNGSNALYFANAANGSNPWNSSDLSALSKIHITDFDVVKLPSIMTVPGH